MKRYRKYSWKKAIFALGVAAIAAGVAFNVGISSRGSSISDLSLSDVEALAQENEQEPPNCYRIASTCNCKLNGVFHSVSITACEHYYHPLCNTTCTVTPCPYGTKC